MDSRDDTALSEFDGGRLLAVHERSTDEPVIESILDAAAEAGIMLDTQDPVLNDFVDADGLMRLARVDDGSPGFRAVVLELWDLTFVVTRSVVEVRDH
ncbi:MAG: hypothetical protein ABEJ28_09400 [Salinigranum sp.]